jgi:hypothetical protein
MRHRMLVLLAAIGLVGLAWSLPLVLGQPRQPGEKPAGKSDPAEKAGTKTAAKSDKTQDVMRDLSASQAADGPFGYLTYVQPGDGEEQHVDAATLGFTLPVGARVGVSPGGAPGRHNFILMMWVEDAKGNSVAEGGSVVTLSPGMTVDFGTWGYHSRPQPGQYRLKATLSAGTGDGKTVELVARTSTYTVVQSPDRGSGQDSVPPRWRGASDPQPAPNNLVRQGNVQDFGLGEFGLASGGGTPAVRRMPSAPGGGARSTVPPPPRVPFIVPTTGPPQSPSLPRFNPGQIPLPRIPAQQSPSPPRFPGSSPRDPFGGTGFQNPRGNDPFGSKSGDPLGGVGVSDAGVGIRDPRLSESFDTPDAAAAAGFQWVLGNSMEWKQKEFGFWVIKKHYAQPNANAGAYPTVVWKYHYTTPEMGSETWVSPAVPKDLLRVAFCHTHPKARGYSRADVDRFKKMNTAPDTMAWYLMDPYQQLWRATTEQDFGRGQLGSSVSWGTKKK